MKKKKNLKDRFFLSTPPDLNLILDVILINFFGLVMIYSASYYYGPYAYHYTPEYIFLSQLKYVFAGLLFMVLLSFFRPGFFLVFWPAWLVLAACLLAAVKIPGVGYESHGAYRWIQLGPVRFQAAEPIKVLLILATAGFLYRFSIRRREILWTVLITYALFALGFLLLSDNMSTAMIVFLMIYFTLIVIYPKPKPFLFLILAGIAALLLGLLIIDHIPFSEKENFRITRIRAWMHPSDTRFAGDEAYQSQLALYAIASGGFFGKGLGQSLMKYSLPEPHNDYILAVTFEELGIFGVLILSYLYLYLLYRLYKIYRSCREIYSRVVVLGVFFHITFQVLINYAVTLGLLPTMGVTLPFVSAGGSSAVFTLAEIGFCLGIDRQNKETVLYLKAEKEVLRENPEYREIVEDAAKRADIRRDRRKKNDR